MASTVGEDAEATNLANIRQVIAALRQSEPLLKGQVATGALTIVGGHYDLDTGIVTWLDQPAPAK